ncbi:hypothetical protein F5Y00DRAFT_149264 [Daldinia vernicosa]|uniref:uncharacterized protein n=1 Tax=Daldinia vernicosa TaxID=114800 RepID=UPI00200745BB|nr:uncharacterized protein F5Y00DRAFT_149264 [Daldinia vernicosa]KAI0846117.1 hypothetical protein F5Y00DRAFT_149264 [Daldinia vernicosa]
MVGFADLSIELQELIFQKLREVDEPLLLTLKNASLTCKAWHQLAASILFRRLVFEADTLSEPYELALDHLEFLNSHERLYQYIREVVIRIGFPDVTSDWVLDLRKLLSRLHNLKHVSVGGDQNAHPNAGITHDRTTHGSQESLPMNEFRNALFYDSNYIGRNVTVTLQNYVHTLDRKTLDISILASSKSQESASRSNLTSLRIAFVHRPYDNYGPWKGARSPISPSREVAALLGPHKNLEHLCLELPDSESIGYTCINYENESCRALENIAPITPHLKSLALHGDFFVSDQAWSQWSLIPWSQLESLSLVSTSMIEMLAERLADQSLPSLQTLKLATYMYKPKSPNTLGLPPGKIPFTISVPQLSLTGYQSAALMEYLSRSAQNATSLRKLRFHTIEPGAGPGLSVSDIEQLSICTRLAWLGLDIPRDHHPDNDHPTSSSSWPGYLDAIARLRPLQHLRTFIHNGYGVKDVLNKHGVIRMFQYIQSRKHGCALQSLVICEDHGARRGLWVVWAWSEEKVVIDYRWPAVLRGGDIWDSKVARSIEIWDTGTMEKVQDCATRWKYWKGWWLDETEDLFWGISEGW